MQLGPAVEVAFRSWGDDLVEAVKKVHGQLNFLECELREGFFKGRKFYGGEKIGMLDIVIGSGSHWLSAFDEVAKINLIEPKSFPLFSAWLGDFTEQDVVKDTIPDRFKLLEFISGFRSMMLRSAKPLLINDSRDHNTKENEEGNDGTNHNTNENDEGNEGTDHNTKENEQGNDGSDRNNKENDDVVVINVVNPDAINEQVQF